MKPSSMKIDSATKPKIFFACALALVLLATALPVVAVPGPGSNRAVGTSVDRTNNLVGTYFQFHLTVTNMGRGGVTNVVVQESPPTGLEFAGVSTDAGCSYNPILNP